MELSRTKIIRTKWDTPQGKLWVIQPVVEDLFDDLIALDHQIEKIRNEVRKMTKLNHCNKLIFVQVNDEASEEKEIEYTDIVSEKLFFNR